MHSQVQSAIEAANAGDKPRALEIINQLLAQDSGSVEGWLMMAALTDDEERKVKYLYHVLSIDPTNQIAREELAEMKRIPPLRPGPHKKPAEAPMPQLPLVQAALVAIRNGNKPKALEYLKQRIQENPHDPDPWVVMTDLVDDESRKRQYLQRALKLNPDHQAARMVLNNLNRTAPAASTSNTMTTQTPMPGYVSQTYLPPQKPAPPVRKFRYPLGIRILIYGMALGSLIGLLSGVVDPVISYCLPVTLVAVAGAWVVSMRVEIDASGIHFVQFFIRKELKWDDITSLRTGVQRYHLQLFGSRGKSLKVNSQLEGYDTILAIIRQQRPDLFSEGGIKFSEYRVFKKRLVKYLSIPIGLVVLALGVPALWAPTTNDRIGFIILIAIGLYLISAPLFGVRRVQVDPQVLTIDWLFRNEEYRPHHIAEIRLDTIRSRYGMAHHYVVIKPQDDKSIQLTDFTQDTDLLYGVLMNWWQRGRQ